MRKALAFLTLIAFTATINGQNTVTLYLYDEYAYGERSAGNWLFEVYSDATAPTS